MYLVIVAIGLTLIVFGVFKWQIYSRLSKWQKCRATITEIEFRKTDLGEGMYSQIIRIKPEIKYSYSVLGEMYTSTKISPDQLNYALLENEFPDSPFSKWKQGSIIEVVYDPKNPNMSYVFSKISKRSASHIYSLVLSGFLLCIFAWVIRGLNA